VIQKRFDFYCAIWKILHRLWTALRNIASISLEMSYSEHRRKRIIMAMTAEDEEEKIYFTVYRSISFFTGFVEYQEQGLHQQREKNEQTNICFANI
jgi:hypothetical protein